MTATFEHDHLTVESFEGADQEYYDQCLVLAQYVYKLVNHPGRCSREGVKLQVNVALLSPSPYNLFWAIHEGWSYVHAECLDRAKDRDMYNKFSQIYSIISKRGILNASTIQEGPSWSNGICL